MVARGTVTVRDTRDGSEGAAAATALAAKLGAAYGALPGVVAVAWAGSAAAGRADTSSDVDLYVYADAGPAVADRARLATPRATRLELDNRTWEPGDEWDDVTGIHVDAMFRTCAFLEEQFDRMLVRHEAWAGYSTCFWANVLQSRALFDPTGWYARMQERARLPYPEPLRRAIVRKNHRLLRGTLSSYRHQVELACRRGDRVSVQHRTTALLASVFDVLFALNRLPHPGEKRLLAIAETCAIKPPHFADDATALIEAAAQPGDAVLARLDALADALDRIVNDALDL